jgi:hypothetical protein
MVILRLVLGMVAFIIAVKILGILLTLVGFALGLLKLAVILGVLVFIGWVIYKLIAPRSAEPV